MRSSADRAHAVEDVLPVGLPAQRRAQAALQEAPALRESALIVEREVLTRELRVRDDDVRDALLERAVDDRERVVASEVARGEDQVVACDRPQHVSRLGQEPSVGIGDVHGVDAQSEAPKLVLEPRPLGNLVPVLRLGPPGRLRGRVDRRHPDDPGALARGDLDGEGVHAAHGPVEGQSADDLHLRDESRDDLRALGRGRVVRLEREPREPELGETLRERAVVDPPLRHVRSDVDVQVVRALHEHARSLAR